MRGFVSNPLKNIARRTVQRAKITSAPIESGANFSSDSAPVQTPLTRVVGDGTAGNPYRSQNVLFWGLDNWGEADWDQN